MGLQVGKSDKANQGWKTILGNCFCLSLEFLLSKYIRFVNIQSYIDIYMQSSLTLMVLHVENNRKVLDFTPPRTHTLVTALTRFPFKILTYT